MLTLHSTVLEAPYQTLQRVDQWRLSGAPSSSKYQFFSPFSETFQRTNYRQPTSDHSHNFQISNNPIRSITLKSLTVLSIYNKTIYIHPPMKIRLKKSRPEWTEPPLSEDRGVGGFSLDEEPSAKVKKEALWNKNETKPINKKIKLSYDSRLETNNLRVKQSDERTAVRERPKKSLTPVLKANNSKKIKKSPKKKRNPVFEFQKKEPDTVIDSNQENEDYCSCCGGIGIFLCCEGCPKSFHFSCCDPPLDSSNLPEGEWFCRNCLAKRIRPKKYAVGIFSKLLNQAELRNPLCFTLPKKLREAFENVATGPFGEYVDTSAKKKGKAEDLGEAAVEFCYYCRESNLSKPLIGCDFCPQSFHLDCLNPPLVAPKSERKTKWRCPLHSSDLTPSVRRLFKNRPIVETSLSRGFKNDGNIQVESSISAPMSDEMVKNATSKCITYKVPEKTIVLDFLETQRKQREERLCVDALEKLQTDSWDADYLYIKKLVEKKGREALLRFLME